jgi:dephospho-CoA kinase
MQKIIGVSGAIGAGKTTVCGILVKRGYIHLSFGKLIENMVKEENASFTRKELQDKGEELIRILGYSGLVDLLLKMNKVDKVSNYAIDGIRHIEVYTYLKEMFGNSFKLIFVEAPLSIRLERIIARSRKDPGITSAEKLANLENRNIEKMTSDLKGYADLTIQNVSTKKYLEAVLERFL